MYGHCTATIGASARMSSEWTTVREGPQGRQRPDLYVVCGPVSVRTESIHIGGPGRGRTCDQGIMGPPDQFDGVSHGPAASAIALLNRSCISKAGRLWTAQLGNPMLGECWVRQPSLSPSDDSSPRRAQVRHSQRL